MDERKTIQIVPYDPNWRHIFETESKLIKEALGDNFLDIHHIGSTSVPDLVAKPKIDIIAVVKNGELSIRQLEKIAFSYKGEWNIPFKLGFIKRSKHKINLHVFEENHPEIEANILFRDYLINHSEVKASYSALKEQLLLDESVHQRSDTGFYYYTLRKGNFIRNVLRKAGFDQMRMLKCNDDLEWKAAKHFRDTYFFGPHDTDDPYTWTFNHEEHAHLVLYQGVDIIGYVHIQFWSKSRAVIRIIAIDKDKRNQNVGSQFLILIEKWLKVQGIKNIHTESRQSSLKFYLKNGYSNMPFDDPESQEFYPNDVQLGKML